MSWLLTGGAGYIGSHVLRAMVDEGLQVVVLDDLSSGLESRVPNHVPLITGSVLDGELLRATLRNHGVTGVVHLGAKKSVPVSVEQPLHYYRENVVGVLTLLEAMVAEGVSNLVFSSSAAVYGTSDAAQVAEDSPTLPDSPYGRTKLMCEWMIRDAAAAFGLSIMSLRYFNVVGCGDTDLAEVGGTNLFPLVFRALSEGRQPVVFGDDYPTRDGSCVRDYIHVEDLASAHVAAVRRVTDARVDETVNVGCGVGHTVLEVLDAIGATTGLDTTPVIAPRRAGDPASMVAATGLSEEILGWRARHGLTAMVESAWRGAQASRPDSSPVPALGGSSAS
ncbi:UDP-glucose 4-epimerase GalE [Demequina sp. NBRC 110056]|uniref:UDP-glucose 4-epimerase GalE n=1 Tax=Demequina sp. NBRC 110056 TaxID=1570345 RepID=UPI000A026433|nr:UDP-glucose 4-epimerase GalE [Demequina sp. NBRC 110056]